MSKESRTSCETCTYYIYDEEYECYLCDKNMDEDDYIRLMTKMIILLLENSCRIIEKARKYKTKRKNKKKSGRIVGSDSPVF